MVIMSTAQRGNAPRAKHVATRRVRDDLWRVVSASGLTLGYIARVDEAAGRVFEARRLLPAGTALMPIGSGWSIADALGCFTGP